MSDTSARTQCSQPSKVAGAFLQALRNVVLLPTPLDDFAAIFVRVCQITAG